MNSKEYALIVAGGKGSRFGGGIPKQFVALQGLPVLMHTLEAFYRYNEDIAIVLVLPEADFNTWHSLCAKYQFTRPITLQSGGQSRFQSVRRGLTKISEDGLVAIHDGVRPLVSTDIIARSFQCARQHRSAIAAVDLKESLRTVTPAGTHAVDRSAYKLIQTPQTFRVSMVKQAYELDEDSTLTDDASVVEKHGDSVFLYEGSYDNIKITTEGDLILAEAVLRSRQHNSY